MTKRLRWLAQRSLTSTTVAAGALMLSLLIIAGASRRFGAQAPLYAFPGGAKLPRLLPLLNMTIAACAFVAVTQTLLERRRYTVAAARSFAPYLAIWCLSALGMAQFDVPAAVWLAMAAAVPFVLRPPDQSRVVARTLAFTFTRLVIVVSLLGAVLFSSWAYVPFEIAPGGWMTGAPRLQGPFPHPNPLGWVAVFAALLELHGRRGDKRRWLWFTAAAVCLTLTGSRAAIGAGFAALAVAEMSARKFKRRSSRFILVLLGGACLGVLLSAVASNMTDIGTLNGRTAVWANAMAAWSGSPIMGTGPGAYLVHSPFLRTVANGHNQILHTLAELGVIGLMALAWATGMTVLRAFRTADGMRPLALGTAVAWCVLYSTENILQFSDVVHTVPIVVFLLTMTVAQAGDVEGAPSAVAPLPYHIAWTSRSIRKKI